ncbi:hypothetical protein J5N97_006160 [Dioscorea zingiberensis]|uniref:non-specific serine/threonine protein kinase n=1 Tax=Dioscorea zingiberensis TaxID=325984 RepID=A0A9D5DB05_9LILI|nr:hypothetical protein J5N97_006160 [Dioscorea zingiberensis]
MLLSKALVFIFFLPKLVVSSSNNNFIFNGFRDANLSLNGLADITSDGLLRLTNNTKAGLGHAFYPLPLHFKDSSKSNGTILPFSTTFAFVIQTKDDDVSGHGLAFATSPSKELTGAFPNQYLGLFNNISHGSSGNHIVAVELDTVQNMDYGDINDNHVGIDIEDLKSVTSHEAAYVADEDGDWKSLKLVSGKPMQVWIDYSAMDMQLHVVISPLGVPKPRHPLLSTKVNLSAIILDDMYVGFSASNGAATSSHYILGWSFSLNGNMQALDSSQLPFAPSLGKKRISPLLMVVLPLVAVLLLLLSLGGIMLILKRRKKYAEVLEEWELELGPHRFSYKDLYKATRGFKEEYLLGVGGFGRVYKGVLPSSKLEIAVKKISHESRQGMREFISEIVSMGRLRHRNLVQLLGYCRRQGELILVYDFMPNGSLDKFLFDKTKSSLSWSQRFQVIKGVASGLLYLHEEWEQVVIHRDIKASNILLDCEFNARLSDFGLARLYDHGSNPQTTRVVGTIGYLAPEISKTGKATASTDVYAFGAFLLEVACGRRPLEVRSIGESPGLTDMVLECWKRGVLLNAKDPKLGNDYVSEELELVLRLGLFCSHPEPTSRPSMRQVMRFLEGDAPLHLSPDRLSASVSASSYDYSFDNVILSYPSIADTSTSARGSSMEAITLMHSDV